MTPTDARSGRLDARAQTHRKQREDRESVLSLRCRPRALFRRALGARPNERAVDDQAASAFANSR